jgi:hypothetical protein
MRIAHRTGLGHGKGAAAQLAEDIADHRQPGCALVLAAQIGEVRRQQAETSGEHRRHLGEHAGLLEQVGHPVGGDPHECWRRGDHGRRTVRPAEQPDLADADAGIADRGDHDVTLANLQLALDEDHQRARGTALLDHHRAGVEPS